MKKINIILSLFLLAPIMFVSASIDKNLSYGLQNDSQVKELQEFLIDQGYLTGEATGNYYSLTLSAVKKFQTANSLPSTGYFGSLSRQKVNDILAKNLQSSNQQATTETGTTTPIATTSSTTGDISRENLIALLQKLLNSQKQNSQQSQSVIQQQTQNTQQPQQTTQSSTSETVDTPATSATSSASLYFDQVPTVVLNGPTYANLSWHSQNITNCVASGNWSGVKNANGSEKLQYTKAGDYSYTLICGSTDGSSMSKTTAVKVVSAIPAISIKTNGNEVDSFIVKPNSTVKLAWTATVATGEALQCTANDQVVASDGNKDVVISSPITFKLKCIANGVQTEKSVYIKTPGILMISVDGPSSIEQKVSSDGQAMLVRFKVSALENDIEPEEARFTISPNASSIIKNANNNTITKDIGGKVDAYSSRLQTVELDFGSPNNIPAEGITFQLTNNYARYIGADGVEVVTDTPGANNTQPVVNITLTRQ